MGQSMCLPVLQRKTSKKAPGATEPAISVTQVVLTKETRQQMQQHVRRPSRDIGTVLGGKLLHKMDLMKELPELPASESLPVNRHAETVEPPVRTRAATGLQFCIDPIPRHRPGGYIVGMYAPKTPMPRAGRVASDSCSKTRAMSEPIVLYQNSYLPFREPQVGLAKADSTSHRRRVTGKHVPIPLCLEDLNSGPLKEVTATVAGPLVVETEGSAAVVVRPASQAGHEPIQPVGAQASAATNEDSGDGMKYRLSIPDLGPIWRRLSVVFGDLIYRQGNSEASM